MKPPPPASESKPATVRGRFTISEHITTPHHWDLFLEREGMLRTWSLPSVPPEGAFALPALQHYDHRPLYLDYEGELSGGRGKVKRWDTGTFSAVWGEKEIRLSLGGARLKGEFLLEFANPGLRAEWVLRRI